MHCYIANTFFLKRTHKTIQSPWASVRNFEKSGKVKESTSAPGLLRPFQISTKRTGNEVGLRVGKKVQSDKIPQFLQSTGTHKKEKRD